MTKRRKRPIEFEDKLKIVLGGCRDEIIENVNAFVEQSDLVGWFLSEVVTLRYSRTYVILLGPLGRSSNVGIRLGVTYKLEVFINGTSVSARSVRQLYHQYYTQVSRSMEILFYKIFELKM